MYSSVADVKEMQSMCAAIADSATRSQQDKDRVPVIQKALGVSWNRALEFLGGKARRVDGWEKDLARERIAELKRAEQQRQAAEHIAYLNRCLGHLKASDPELLGPHVDVIERALAAGGVLDRAMAETQGQA